MYNIRVANRQDVLPIAQIHTACWAECYGYLPEGMLKARDLEFRVNQWNKLTLSSPDSRTLVLEVDGDVVGFGHVKKNEDSDLEGADVELHACYFLPEYRGWAAGPDMMMRMAIWAQTRGFRSCGIWAWKENPIRQTYSALGLKVVSRRKRTIGSESASEVGYVCSDISHLLAKLAAMIASNERRALQGKNRRSEPDRLTQILKRSGTVR